MSVFWLYVGVSLFTINGLYVYIVVCVVVYAYNLTEGQKNLKGLIKDNTPNKSAKQQTPPSAEKPNKQAE